MVDPDAGLRFDNPMIHALKMAARGMAFALAMQPLCGLKIIEAGHLITSS